MTWGGRCSVGWLTGPLSQVRPNRIRSPPLAPAPRVRGFSGSLSGVVRHSPRCAQAAAGARWTHDQRRVTHQALRPVHGRRPRVLHGRHRSRHRLPRPQRRRQVDHHARSWSASPGPPSGRVTVSGRDYRDLPNPGLEVGVLLDASAQHAGRTGREILTIAQQTMGLPKSQVAETLARVGLTDTEAAAPGARLLPRHAPAPGPRDRPDRRSRGAHPRRAGQRPRPGGHPLDARPAARLRQRRRHRAAVLAPAARDRGHRRRPRRHRPGPDRGPGQQERAAGRGRHPRPHGRRPTASPVPCTRHRSSPPRSTAACASTPNPSSWARRHTVPASSCVSCAPPTAPAWRRCSSSSPPTPLAKEQQHDHRHRSPRPGHRRGRGAPRPAPSRPSR